MAAETASDEALAARVSSCLESTQPSRATALIAVMVKPPASATETAEPRYHTGCSDGCTDFLCAGQAAVAAVHLHASEHSPAASAILTGLVWSQDSHSPGTEAAGSIMEAQVRLDGSVHVTGSSQQSG